MPKAPANERWAAIRAICEGSPPTFERVAAAAGIETGTLTRRAGAEGWKAPDMPLPRGRVAGRTGIDAIAPAAGEEPDPDDEVGGLAAAEPAEAPEPWPDEPPAARVARIGAVLTKHTEAILRRAEAGLPLESRQIAALSSLVALAERIAAMAREATQQEEQDRDGKIADALRRIDGRIVYLARCEARRLAVDLLGVPQAEVDAKIPEPGNEPARPRRRRETAANA